MKRSTVIKTSKNSHSCLLGEFSEDFWCIINRGNMARTQFKKRLTLIFALFIWGRATIINKSTPLKIIIKQDSR